MFGKPKPKGLDVMIAVGKPKPKPELSEPDSLEEKKPEPKFPKPAAPTAAHEAVETPEYEAAEEAGVGMLAEIESAGEEHGLDAEQSRAFASKVFSAALKCLGGEKPESNESQAEEENEDGIY